MIEGRPGAAGGGRRQLVMLGKSKFPPKISENVMFGLVPRRQHEGSGLEHSVFLRRDESSSRATFEKNTISCFFYPKNVPFFDILW